MFRIIFKRMLCSEAGKEKRSPGIFKLPQWRKKWEERSDFWQSKFKNILPDTTVKIAYLELVAGSELKKKELVEFWLNYKDKKSGNDQVYRWERSNFLGEDIASAHFFTFRGGSIRFYNDSDWIHGVKGTANLSLPNKRNITKVIEMIDCEHFLDGTLNIRGLDNIIKLEKLRWLSLRNNVHIDDWCLDKLTGSTHKTLEYLDIGGCSVTANGLVSLYKFEKLNILVLYKNQIDEDMETVIAMLEAEKPDLLIKLI